MIVIIRGRGIARGCATGRALVSPAPISFLSGVNPETGMIVEKGHPLEGQSIAGRVLVFPHGKGSTVGSYILYALSRNGKAPAALINAEAEPIIAVGAIIGQIPLVDQLEGFVEHKIFTGLKSVVGWDNTEDLDNFVIKLAERTKRPITYRNPIVDATLPDGSRINIVYSTDISRKGSNFTIRKAMDDPISILKLIEFKTCDYMVAAYLWICIENGMSLFMSGETASGKTTSLNALTTFIPPENKIVTIEDTPELQVPHKNWTREVSKGKGKGEGEGSDVTMFDLLKAALRQRPNQILVGEIRGVEGSVAFGAMQTGHPVLSTFHAASVEKLIQRLCGDPINIPKTYVDNLNIVVIQSAVKRPTGETVRRMLSVNELVGFNPETQGFSFVEMFHWDPVTDTHEFTGRGSSYLLENKIATMLGIPEHKKAAIYEEVEKRARILERLHKAGYTGFYDLYHMMTKIKKQGLLKIDIDSM